MSSTRFKISDDFEAAPKAERIEFVQELWDKIASDPDTIAVPESHRRILDKRLEELNRSRESGRPWSEVRERLLAALRSN